MPRRPGVLEDASKIEPSLGEMGEEDSEVPKEKKKESI